MNLYISSGGVLVWLSVWSKVQTTLWSTYKLYDLHANFYSRLSVSKSIFMFPQVIIFYCFSVEAPYLWRPLGNCPVCPGPLKSGPGKSLYCATRLIASCSVKMKSASRLCRNMLSAKLNLAICSEFQLFYTMICDTAESNQAYLTRKKTKKKECRGAFLRPHDCEKPYSGVDKRAAFCSN